MFVIVYYICINELNDWKSIVSGQINDILSLKCELYCVICAKTAELVNECKQILPACSTEYTLTNNFEYPGIRKLYCLGTMYPDKIFFYMHTKGMFFHNNSGRTQAEKWILHHTIKYWEYILFIFDNYPWISKAGLFPGHEGNVWCNFFWVRGHFLKSLKEPEISKDRYYYEHYISSPKKDCFNLLTFDTTTVDQKDVMVIFPKINCEKYKMKYPDLSRMSYKKLNSHFFNYGIKERRDLL